MGIYPIKPQQILPCKNRYNFNFQVKCLPYLADEKAGDKEHSSTR
jgi:hypothetical protein